MHKQKHLEFIQAAINRMASNLFLLKGWTVTLIAALFALANNESKDAYFLIAYFPAIVFWALDGYFLSMERRFRALYDSVRVKVEDDIDYSMDTLAFKDEHTWAKAMLSRTLSIYYGGLILTMIVVMFIMN